MESAFRYRAFISYSHRDETWARWLHRGLEATACRVGWSASKPHTVRCRPGSRRCSAIAMNWPPRRTSVQR